MIHLQGRPMLMLMLPLLLAAATGTAAGTQPAPGHYDAARLCVTVNTQAPNCGPVQAQLGPDGGLSVRIDDIRYLLSFEPGVP